MSKSRKELEHKQRRKYILECAEKLFAEKGFDGVTVADIAKTSEFSVGSFYLFFESKEALIKQLLLDRLRQVLQITSTQVKKDIPAVEKLEKTVSGLVNMFLKHMAFFKLYMTDVKGSEWFHPPGDFGKELNRLVKSNFLEIISIFEQGKKEGAFRDDVAPLHMALFLESSLHSYMSYIAIIDDDLPVEKMRKGMQVMFYDGILKRGKDRRK